MRAFLELMQIDLIEHRTFVLFVYNWLDYLYLTFTAAKESIGYPVSTISPYFDV